MLTLSVGKISFQETFVQCAFSQVRKHACGNGPYVFIFNQLFARKNARKIAYMEKQPYTDLISRLAEGTQS